jgi:hypothetical protein
LRLGVLVSNIPLATVPRPDEFILSEKAAVGRESEAHPAFGGLTGCLWKRGIERDLKI